MWGHSLSFFGENNHHMAKFLQEKKIVFSKHNAKKNLQIIILHVLQVVKKKNKKTKQKPEKKSACTESK